MLFIAFEKTSKKTSWHVLTSFVLRLFLTWLFFVGFYFDIDKDYFYFYLNFGTACSILQGCSLKFGSLKFLNIFYLWWSIFLITLYTIGIFTRFGIYKNMNFVRRRLEKPFIFFICLPKWMYSVWWKFVFKCMYPHNYLNATFSLKILLSRRNDIN